VIGASGFIGAAMTQHLRRLGYDCQAIGRRNFELPKGNLGHVIYAAGVTGDFRARAFDTVDAHVTRLNQTIASMDCESLLYLSSARIYYGSQSTTETADIVINPQDPDQFYNATKIAGEARCLRTERRTFRVARLSNVYGTQDQSGNFLTSIIRDARKGLVELQTSFSSAKDYISIEDVIRALTSIALHGQHRIYNVASGVNVTNGVIVETLVRITGCEVRTVPSAPTRLFPVIAIERLVSEFAFQAKDLVSELPALVAGSDAALKLDAIE
jgi:nucleoside-diphosphate-sugar epimerase